MLEFPVNKAEQRDKKDGTTEVRQENTSTGFISSEVHMELTPSNIRELNDVTM